MVVSDKRLAHSISKEKLEWKKLDDIFESATLEDLKKVYERRAKA